MWKCLPPCVVWRTFIPCSRDCRSLASTTPTTSSSTTACRGVTSTTPRTGSSTTRPRSPSARPTVRRRRALLFVLSSALDLTSLFVPTQQLCQTTTNPERRSTSVVGGAQLRPHSSASRSPYVVAPLRRSLNTLLIPRATTRACVSSGKASGRVTRTSSPYT